MTTSKREHITPVLAELHSLHVTARIDVKIAVITFNLLIAEQVTYVNFSNSFVRRDRLGQAITSSQSTKHFTSTHCICTYSGVFPMLLLVSGIHYLIQSLMIWTSLHQS